MANPYGIPDAAMTPGSPFALAENQKRHNELVAQSEYMRQMQTLQIAQARAQQTAQGKPPSLGAVTQALADPTLPANVRTAYEGLRDKLMADQGFPVAPIPAPVVNPNIPKAREHGLLTPLMNVASEAVGGVANTIPGLVGLAGQGLDALGLPGAETAIKAGAGAEQWVRENVTDYFKTDEGIKEKEAFMTRLNDPNANFEDLASTLASNKSLTTGIIASFVAPGGLALKGAQLAGKTNTMARLATVLSKSRVGKFAANNARAASVSTSMSAAELGNISNQVYNQVIQEGGTPADAQAASSRTVQSKEALAAAALGSIPIVEHIFGPIAGKPGLANRFWRGIKTGFGEMAQEGGQEGLQQRAQNIGTQETDLNKGVAPAAMLGAVLGGPVGFAAGALGPTTDPNAGIKPPPVVDPTTGTPVAGGDAITNFLNQPNKSGTKSAVGDITRRIFAKAKDDASAKTAIINALSTNTLHLKDAALKTPEALGAYAESLIAERAKVAAAAVAGQPATGVQTPPVTATAAPGTAVDGIPEPTPLGSQATAASLITPTAQVDSAVSSAEKIPEANAKLQGVVETAAKAPENAAFKFAEAADIFDEKKGRVDLAETADTLREEMLNEERKITEAQANSRNLEVQVRKDVYNYLYNNAKIRAATDQQAAAYARDVSSQIVIPQTGTKEQIKASITRQLAEADARQASQRPPVPQAPTLRENADRLLAESAARQNQVGIQQQQGAQIASSATALGQQDKSFVPDIDVFFNNNPEIAKEYIAADPATQDAIDEVAAESPAPMDVLEAQDKIAEKKAAKAARDKISKAKRKAQGPK